MLFPDVHLDQNLDYVDQDSDQALVKAGIHRACELLGFDRLLTNSVVSDRLHDITGDVDWDVAAETQGDYEQNIIHQAEMATFKTLINNTPGMGQTPF